MSIQYAPKECTQQNLLVFLCYGGEAKCVLTKNGCCFCQAHLPLTLHIAVATRAIIYSQRRTDHPLSHKTKGHSNRWPTTLHASQFDSILWGQILMISLQWMGRSSSSHHRMISIHCQKKFIHEVPMISITSRCLPGRAFTAHPTFPYHNAIGRCSPTSNGFPLFGGPASQSTSGATKRAGTNCGPNFISCCRPWRTLYASGLCSTNSFRGRKRGFDRTRQWKFNYFIYLFYSVSLIYIF